MADEFRTHLQARAGSGIKKHAFPWLGSGKPTTLRQTVTGTRAPRNVSLNLFSQQVDTNRPFQFQKCSPFFTRTHHETLFVVAVCVSNPDRSSAGHRSQTVRVLCLSVFIFSTHKLKIFRASTHAPPPLSAVKLSHLDRNTSRRRADCAKMRRKAFVARDSALLPVCLPTCSVFWQPPSMEAEIDCKLQSNSR